MVAIWEMEEITGYKGKQLRASGSLTVFAHHRIQEPVGTVLSTKLPTVYHHNSTIELRLCWCVWKVGEGFPGQV